MFGHYGIWALEGLKALYSAISSDYFIVLYDCTLKFYWTLSVHICSHSCLFCATKANERNGKKQLILPRDSFIYLCSTWCQTICPWKVLKNWTCVKFIRKNLNPSTEVSAWFLSSRNSPLVDFVVLRSIFIKCLKKI